MSFGMWLAWPSSFYGTFHSVTINSGSYLVMLR
jgi:hypothetical protein